MIDPKVLDEIEGARAHWREVDRRYRVGEATVIQNHEALHGYYETIDQHIDALLAAARAASPPVAVGAVPSVEALAAIICKSGKFETGQGTCALICMDQLGSARKGCHHAALVHEKLARAIHAAYATGAGAGAASFQERVQPWMMACFGPEISADRLERSDRFIEEALELVQASGYDKERAHALVEYVYGRDQGDINQEVGGVMVTLAAHCLAFGVDMHAAAETELARIWTKVETIRAKQSAKPKGSALPVALPATGAGAASGWREKAAALWALLDDIDTLDDAARSDDEGFRKAAYAKQRQRFDIMTGEEWDATKFAANLRAAQQGEDRNG